MRRGGGRIGPTLWRALLLLVAALTGGAAAARTGPTLPELVQVADIEALSSSPDAGLVAFRVERGSIQRNSYDIDWYVADVRTGMVRWISAGGDPIYNDGILESEPAIWSPDGRFIYFRALVDGAIGIWRAATDGSGSRLLAGGDADVEKLVASADGRSLLFVTGPTRDEIARAERREYDDGILIDATVDPYQGLFRGGWVHGRLASQRLVGNWYQRDGLLWQAKRTQHSLDLTSLATGPEQPVSPPVVAPMKLALPDPTYRATDGSGTTVIARAGDGGGLEVRRPDGSRIPCTAPACRSDLIAAVAWRPGGEEVLFTTEDHHYRQTLRAWNVRTGRVRSVFKADGLLGGGRSPHAPCAITVTQAICVAAGAVAPPRLVQIDLRTGEGLTLFDPNSAIRLRTAPRVEQLAWRLADGRTATGTLLLPPGKDPVRAPLFLTYYLCPGYLRGGTGDAFPLPELVDAGFVVACLNMLPYKSWGDGADHYRAALASVEALVDLLDRRGLIDRSRIGMGGFSAGSEAAMWIAMNSTLLAAASISSPQYEPAAYWMSSVRGRDEAKVLREFMRAGPPDQDPDRWRVISPALNTERIKAPLLIQLPEQEVRAGMELYARLSNTATPVEMYGFPDEAHVKIQPRHRLAVYQRNLDWFRYWLQDRSDPDPARADQYRRWNAMRARRAGSGPE